MNAEDENQEELVARIRELEEQLAGLKDQLRKSHSVVKVPGQLQDIFTEAEKRVDSYFSDLEINPEKGMIDIDGDRYILVRASALSYDFIHTVTRMYADSSPEKAFEEGKNFLFDIGHVIGREDAKLFHQKIKVASELEKLATGPVHFAYTGWASVVIHPESKPVPGDDFFLKYSHPYSFEADSWISKGEKSSQPVCVMNAAYSAAWCQESFGMQLSAVEITCKAKGDEQCTFVMAPPDRITDYLKGYQKAEDEEIKVPFFFERKQITERLRENEQLLQDAQKMVRLGSWHFNLQTKNLIWTDELYRIFEFKNEYNPDLYQNYLSRYTPDELPILKDHVTAAIEHKKKYNFRHSIVMDDGRIKWVYCLGVPVENKEGEVVALKGIVQDITNEVQKEIELESFFDLSVDLMAVANDNYFVKLSHSWSDLLGYSLEEMYSRPITDFVHPDDVAVTNEEINHLNNGEISLHFENRYICKDGRVVVLSWSSAPHSATNLVYAAARDITEQKAEEEQLKLTISEKETLLQEIHHRVKNNLQVISSLLSLQSKMNEENLELKRLYDDSINRIKSMASLHELFYKSIDRDRINFEEYTNKLVLDLLYSFRGEAHNIRPEIIVRDVFVNLDTAVPLGLLINEIITNSLKHGFHGRENGKIYIRLQKTGNGELCLEIGDNGSGFTSGIDISEAESMGLILISSLAEQLEGEIKRDMNSKGTHYTLRFKEIIL